MSKQTQQLPSKLMQLAESIVDQALADGVPIDVQIDALKTVASYHIGVTKAKAKTEDEENIITFDQLIKHVDSNKDKDNG